MPTQKSTFLQFTNNSVPDQKSNPLSQFHLKTSPPSISDYIKSYNEDANPHFRDLTETHKNKSAATQSFTSLPTLFPSLTYMVYVHRAIRNLLFTILFDWSMPLFHPVNFILIMTVFPTIVISLVVVELSLKLSFYCGLGNVLNGISKKWGDGLSPVNWWDPRLFSEEVSEIINDGLLGLEQPLPTTQKYHHQATKFDITSTKKARPFNLDIAETLLLMSAIVYERDDMKVRNAHKKITDLAKNKLERTSEAYQDVNRQLYESELRIREQSQKWGLEFTSLSELNSLGGPFAGMFWSYEHRFIVVVFKGTTPTDFEDFLVDSMIQRIDARGYVFGEIHEGFYTSLFPDGGHKTSRGHSASPYITIIKAIRAKALQIRSRQSSSASTSNNNSSSFSLDQPINLWVTGHSLGAALGTLFYSRLLRSPLDLGENCILRDGYLFGTPAIGDADFAAHFSAVSNDPFDRPNTLWRVINDTDIITKLPPGYEDPGIRRLVNKMNLLNYAHVGEGVRFFQNGRKPVSTCDSFDTAVEPVIVERKRSDYSLASIFGWNTLKGEEVDTENETGIKFMKNGKLWSSRKDVFRTKPLHEHPARSPLIWMERILPSFFQNHLPIRYFEAMQRARVHFENVEDEDHNANERNNNDQSSENSRINRVVGKSDKGEEFDRNVNITNALEEECESDNKSDISNSS
ncbi:hypothetical protein G9A89_004935 [Geosiphon pyriformis]|nr:hypothetical protein G9A89_004935 [Geosiphon pyriformis]